MSHFTTVATKINNIACLLKALDKLKLKYTHSEQGVEVRGWRGQKSTAEASINMGRYDKIGRASCRERVSSPV